ncbi:MAG: AAA family ATPase [Betaproteobacteria bacterium HGW-Betaproteobacteria-12]|nr:MAG: AAA family ATPase [Betaproteobacteria bacterium HGW-Betaproteobacteria-12]
MLTRLTIRNFKRLEIADIELGQSVVFIGPNNSGKTSALQALALWEAGVRAWLSKRGSNVQAMKRSGVTLNRKDLIAVAVPNANLLWRDLHVRSGERQEDGKNKTKNIFIEIVVEGVTRGQAWQCGLEFDYANPESFYCRPLRLSPDGAVRMPLPEAELLAEARVAFLPPMSGLASIEPKLEHGRINVLIGEGQTAQVLRNLCYRLAEENPVAWEALRNDVDRLFGAMLNSPEFNTIRGEVTMSYREKTGVELDLSSAGRGLQQTLLLLAYLYANPHTTVLLDEPDAHLEILRQRQIYRIINDVARQQNGQIISASHSEVILSEAADKDTVIAFLGKPHRINNKGSQLQKALNNIGFDHYYLAEERGWILYMEGSTDLDILRAFAKKIAHPAEALLDAPFVHYVGENRPQPARDHFFGLKEAKPDLVGLALFDRINNPLQTEGGLVEKMWTKREIENYICREDILLSWAKGNGPSDLVEEMEAPHRVETMQLCINELVQALETQGKDNPWSDHIKASDEFLIPLMRNYARKLGLPIQTENKARFHELVEFMDAEAIDHEVISILDAIIETASLAMPAA